jgi:Ca2+-binding EF-hand superfamily protein
MKAWCLLFGLAVLTAVLPVAADERKVKEDRLARDDVQDFVLLTDTRPVLVRLHVRIDGEPFRAVWNDFMRHLFETLDVNGDGVLDRGELARAPSVDLLMARGGLGFALPVEKVTARALVETNKDRKVTVADLAAYYRQNGLAPLQVRFGPTPVTLPPSQGQGPGQAGSGLQRDPQRREPSSGIAVARATFALLDTDKTGKLTREKLAAAPVALLRADGDDDEIVTTRELASYADSHRLATVPDVGPVILVHPDEPADELVRGLLARYGPKTDKPADQKLTQKDLGLDTATFALLDTDKDGKLDKEELARFARRPPDLELTVRLSARGQDAHVELNTKDGQLPLAAHVKPKDTAITVDLGTVTVQMHPANHAVRPLGLERLIRTRDTFESLDEDRKGHLVEADTLNPGSGMFRGHFKLIDRDGDGKVTEKELVAYVQRMSDLQARATAACVSLVFIEDVRGLFDLLDADHDGRLIAHEMLKAPALLARLDKDDKGYLVPSDVPGRCQLLVRRGPAAGPGYSALGYGAGYVYPGTEVGSGEDDRPPPEPKAGPLWFRKMDRNGDGFVSRREFPGSDELFNKIDTDGDGLIGVEEAIKADALVRKQP